jgi:hypothetical protein
LLELFALVRENGDKRGSAKNLHHFFLLDSECEAAPTALFYAFCFTMHCITFYKELAVKNHRFYIEGNNNTLMIMVFFLVSCWLFTTVECKKLWRCSL